MPPRRAKRWSEKVVSAEVRGRYDALFCGLLALKFHAGAEGSEPHVLPLSPEARQVFVDDKVKRYVVDVVHATRDPEGAKVASLAGLIENGASPRASINLVKAAKAAALLQGRGYVTPQDVKSIGPDVLRHRIIVSYEAEAESVTSETVIERIFAGLPVP